MSVKSLHGRRVVNIV